MEQDAKVEQTAQPLEQGEVQSADRETNFKRNTITRYGRKGI